MQSTLLQPVMEEDVCFRSMLPSSLWLAMLVLEKVLVDSRSMRLSSVWLAICVSNALTTIFGFGEGVSRF